MFNDVFHVQNLYDHMFLKHLGDVALHSSSGFSLSQFVLFLHVIPDRLDDDYGPYSWKILVLRVAPSNKILRKFLKMWMFPLKIKEKTLVKKKVLQTAS